jgi:hypothetical protein
MENSRKITLHIDGLPKDQGNVRLSVFVEKLDALKSALVESSKVSSDNRAQLSDFVVTDLRHESPAAVTVSEVSAVEWADITGDAIQVFLSAVREITAAARKPIKASYELLEDIASIARGLGQKVTKIWFTADSDDITAVINEDTLANLKELLGGKIKSYGTVKGIVQRYNSHSKEKNFFVYPPIGGRVKCIFKDEDRDIASEAVEKNVMVYGLLKYRDGDYAPFEVNVTKIEVIDADKNLATLSGLSGSSPNATGTQTSLEFIRKARDEWH